LELPGGKVRLEDAGNVANLDTLQFSLHGTPVQQMKVNTDPIHAHAMGELSENVLVRIDNDINLGSSGTIDYSYSLDGGDTWVQGNTAPNTDAAGEYAELPVPGGMLKLAPTDDEAALDENDQFLIQPRTADIDTEVHQGMELAMNTPGVDVFGGHYQNDSGLEPAFEEDQQRNLFLGLGQLIAGLETNDQEKIQASLGSINGAIDQVSRMQADIGARENRLEVSEKVLTDLEQNEKERKSRVEDVDFAELMSRIKQQQTVYQAVMKTSSMIMRMSLMDYL
jgi:flagellar hook-associated protein 3 FlgL